MLPVLTVFADILAIGGGFFVADVVARRLAEGVHRRDDEDVLPRSDVFGGLIKAFVFGGIIALMGCTAGFGPPAAPSVSGTAATRAVVTSCVLILIGDYILTTCFPDPLRRVSGSPSECDDGSTRLRPTAHGSRVITS